MKWQEIAAIFFVDLIVGSFMTDSYELKQCHALLNEAITIINEK